MRKIIKVQMTYCMVFVVVVCLFVFVIVYCLHSIEIVYCLHSIEIVGINSFSVANGLLSTVYFISFTAMFT